MLLGGIFLLLHDGIFREEDQKIVVKLTFPRPDLIFQMTACRTEQTSLRKP